MDTLRSSINFGAVGKDYPKRRETKGILVTVHLDRTYRPIYTDTHIENGSVHSYICYFYVDLYMLEAQTICRAASYRTIFGISTVQYIDPLVDDLAPKRD